MKKLLAVGVIGLFLGLACAPSINANISKESELVEITTEICGLNGGKQTVKLTQHQAIEVEELFDSIREQLNATESREETVEIFNDAVVELDKYGLPGGLSVKQAKRLVTGGFQNSKIIKIIDKLYDRNPTTMDYIYENQFCFTAGIVYPAGSYGLIPWSFFYGSLYLGLLLYIITDNLDLSALLVIIPFSVSSVLGMISNYNPIAIVHIIAFGGEVGSTNSETRYEPAKGWVWTLGTNGEWKRQSPIWGRFDFLLGGLHFGPFGPYRYHVLYPGIIGFTGLKFTLPIKLQSFFLGGCIAAKVSSERPYK